MRIIRGVKVSKHYQVILMKLESKYKVLKSLFKYAVVWRLIDGKDNPMKEIEKPKNINKQNKDFYTKDELKILFDIIEKIPLYQ